MESIPSRVRFSLFPYSAAQQPVQRRLQGEDVAAILPAEPLLLGPSDQAGVDKKVGDEGFHHIGSGVLN